MTLQNYISPEEKFIIYLLQDRLDQFPGDETINKKIDLDKLIVALQWNRLIPYLYHTIRVKHLEDALDKTFISKIAAINKQEVMRQMKREAVLKKTILLLSENNIDVILLKGALFAYTLYSLPELRPSYDIDILIKPGLTQKAQDILIKAGFEKWYELESEHTLGKLPHLPGLKYQGIPVELHHNLFSGFDKQPVTKDEIFSSLEKTKLFNYEMSKLTPPLTLYYLLIHIQKHVAEGYLKLIWILDIILFLKKENIANIHSTTEKWVNQYGKKAEILRLLNFIEEFMSSKITESGYNSESIRYYLNACKNPGKTEYIKTFRTLRKLDTIHEKRNYIYGRIFPSFGYVKYKFGTKRDVWVPFCYLVIYWEYLKKLTRVIWGKGSSKFQ